MADTTREPGSHSRTSSELLALRLPEDTGERLRVQARHGAAVLGAVADGTDCVWGLAGRIPLAPTGAPPPHTNGPDLLEVELLMEVPVTPDQAHPHPLWNTQENTMAQWSAPITPLTPTERKVLEEISLGHAPADGSANLNMAPGTFSRHATLIGHKLQAKKPTLKVQMGFVTGELPLPESLPAPEPFTKTERLLWQVHALHHTAAAIAQAGIDQFDLTGDTARLMAKAEAEAEAEADNEAHLVRLGHAYGILTTDDVPTPSPT
ncbi:helix-turn-helix transcriptional regulator [Streptomyces sp. NPDC059631]|uniref:helix-turn-helix transcriptional regulator n=1 Tax=unclassified Streptomyces TaxID=2593676 RepID=UPI0036746E5C